MNATSGAETAECSQAAAAQVQPKWLQMPRAGPHDGVEGWLGGPGIAGFARRNGTQP